jgi:hypothetical protein
MLLEILNTSDDYVDLAYIMQTASTVLNLTNYDLKIDHLNLTLPELFLNSLKYFYGIIILHVNA